MAGRFGDEVVTDAGAPAVSRFGDAPAQSGDTREGWSAQLGDLGSHLWDSLSSIPKGIAQTATHPLDTIGAVLDQTKHSLTRAKDEWAKGNHSDALANLVTAAPVIGPLITQGGNELQQGKYGAAAGDAGGMYLGAKLPGAAAELAPQVVAKAAELAGPVGAAAKAAVPGLAKMAAGASVEALPIPPILKYAIEAPTVMSGAKQAARGAGKGFQAARDAAAAEEVANLPVRPAQQAAPPAEPSASAPAPQPAPAADPFIRDENGQPLMRKGTEAPGDAATAQQDQLDQHGLSPTDAEAVRTDQQPPAEGSTYPRGTPADINRVAQMYGYKDFASVEGEDRVLIKRLTDGLNSVQVVKPRGAQPLSPSEAGTPLRPPLTAAVNPAKAAFDANAAQPKYGASTESIGKVADHLEANKTTATAAAKLNPGDWQKIAKDAGVDSLSPKGTTQVIAELRARAKPPTKTLAPSAEATQ